MPYKRRLSVHLAQVLRDSNGTVWESLCPRGDHGPVPHLEVPPMLLTTDMLVPLLAAAAGMKSPTGVLRGTAPLDPRTV